MNKNKLSNILNIIIVLLVTLATIMMFLGIRFTSNVLTLEESKLNMFRYFTVDSNILMGISALIMLFTSKSNKIPKWVNILYLISTVGVALTFFVTALFLAPAYGKNFIFLYTNSNLFYHLLVPVLSIINYVFFIKYNNRYIYALYGLITPIVYSFYYFTNIVTHLDNGKISMTYDFYNFLHGDIKNAVIAIPVVFISTYLMSLLLVTFNKKLK